MGYFKNCSIKSKLIWIILSITTFSLVAGFSFVIINDIQTFKRDMLDNTTLIANIVSDYSVPDLAFQYKRWSEETLKKLSLIPNIEYAYLYDADGKRFASYNKTPDLIKPPDIALFPTGFKDHNLYVIKDVVYHDEKMGTIYLCASTESLHRKVKDYLVTMMSLIIVLILLSYFFAVKFQRIISKPILHLADTAKRISEDADYSIRVNKSDEGEIGILYDGFNEMLSQIQKREAERDKAEEALNLSEDRFRHIIEQSNDALFILINRKLVFVNPIFEEYFEYSSKEILDLNFMELLAPESLGDFKNGSNEELIQGFLPGRFIFKGVSKSGKKYDFEASVSEIAWGDMLAALIIARDVTKRIKAEQRLKEQQERLKLYAKELERSNQELEQFAYIASHDLQEPLRKVSTFADRLIMKYSSLLSGQGTDYLERMKGATLRMRTLINDLLAYSRVTSKAQPFVSVDLSQVVKEVLSDLEVRIEQVGGDVEVGDLPTIEADPMQMRQLMQNLIGNSLKFHRDGEPPVVRIEANILKNEGITDVRDTCQIFVRDNGIGLDEKYLDRIFKVFQRLQARSQYEGTGVGLAICRKIVERHGGVITVKSAPGEGATFIVNLPIKQLKGGDA